MFFLPDNEEIEPVTLWEQLGHTHTQKLTRTWAKTYKTLRHSLCSLLERRALEKEISKCPCGVCLGWDKNNISETTAF
jgi:hypothetical protein